MSAFLLNERTRPVEVVAPRVAAGGRRNVEGDLRQQLARDAQIGEAQLRRGSTTTVDSRCSCYLVRRSYGSADRLLDGMGLLGHQDMAWLDRTA